MSHEMLDLLDAMWKREAICLVVEAGGSAVGFQN